MWIGLGQGAGRHSPGPIQESVFKKKKKSVSSFVLLFFSPYGDFRQDCGGRIIDISFGINHRPPRAIFRISQPLPAIIPEREWLSCKFCHRQPQTEEGAQGWVPPCHLSPSDWSSLDEHIPEADPL